MGVPCTSCCLSPPGLPLAVLRVSWRTCPALDPLWSFVGCLGRDMALSSCVMVMVVSLHRCFGCLLRDVVFGAVVFGRVVVVWSGNILLRLVFRAREGVVVVWLETSHDSSEGGVAIPN